MPKQQSKDMLLRRRGGSGEWVVATDYLCRAPSGHDTRDIPCHFSHCRFARASAAHTATGRVDIGPPCREGLKLARLVGSVNRTMFSLRSLTTGGGFQYVLLLTVAVILVGAAGIYAFEEDVPGDRESRISEPRCGGPA